MSAAPPRSAGKGRRAGTELRVGRVQLAMAVVIALLIGTPLLFALLHEGFPAAEVELESSDVWVSNSKDLRAGRLNAQIQELDASVSLVTSDVGIMQDGDTVFIHDRTSGALGRVDPGLTDLRESILTPAGSDAAYGGGVLAVLDRADGRLWLIDATQALNFDQETAPPAAELGPDAQVVVTATGTALAVAPEQRRLVRIDGVGAEPGWEDLPAEIGAFELTAVGEEPVLLDTERGTLLARGGARELGQGALRLQLPSSAASEVVLATADGVLRVPLDGGDVAPLHAEVDGSNATARGTARPAVVAGCIHAAWSHAATTMEACAGSEPHLQAMTVPPSGDLLFRVNRNVVALNDLATGQVWLPQDNLRLVENWNEVVPPEDTDGSEGENDATEESFEATLAERGEENTPPDLRDDEFGVRAGSTGYLPVLDDDSDVDGDILTITGLTGDVPAAFGELRVIDEGRALQFRAAPEASGELTLTYTASDGRPGGVADARLTIRVLPSDAENQAPTTNRRSTVAVESGQKIAYNVLPDWTDPEGDPVYLLSATPPVGDAVGFTPDGRITFTAANAELGERVIPYLVSDGLTQSAGELRVRVEAPGSLGPVGTPDFGRGTVGAPVTVQPLVNDLSPGGAALTIVEIAELGTATGGASFNPDLGTVTFTADSAMTAYVQYTLSAGGRTSIGIIRFDVETPEYAAETVTAVRDLAYLRPGQSNAVDVLANDVSSGESVLSVQSIETTDAARVAGLAVELIDNTIVRLSSQSAIQSPIELPYTVTDGTSTAKGFVIVVPVEPQVTHEPPLATDDTRRVRAGDYTSVAVLENDVHPDEAQMSLAHELTNVDIGDGYAFTTGDEVRLQAPSTAGSYSLGYTVVDEHGEQAAARVSFQVTELDEASNRPPTPGVDTARVFEGATVRVEVPLSGIDPDGDSVTFNGLVGAPTLGSVRETSQTSFVYEAFPGASGTDVLRYEVADGYGQRGEGTIRIGVVARPEVTEPPVAVDDSVRARPSARVAVPVLENDSDPNGYELTLVPELAGVDAALQPEVDGDSVIVTVPADGEFVSVPYTITNGQGGQDAAFIHLTISADAPTMPPTAGDHVVRVDDFAGGDTLSLDVRRGATNPNGRVSELAVDLVGAGKGAATLEVDGRVTVTQRDSRQVIVYRLTDASTNLTAAGFIMVPAVITEESKRQSPYLRPDLPAQKLKVDQAQTWDVNDLVVAPSGNRVTVIEAQAAWAEQGDGGQVVEDATHVRFAPKPGFRGPASITFQVSDATEPGDENAGVATIRLPIAVGDPDFFDVAPTFVAPQLTVEAGTTQQFDLRSATGHPNRDVIQQVSYSGLEGGDDQLAATLGGSSLSIDAGLDAPVGTVARYTVSYTFREFVQSATVTVTVVSTSKPPPRVVGDEALAVRNEPVMLDVTGNDFNPFPESALRMLSANEVSGGATGAAVSVVGGKLRVVPSVHFVGTISVSYRIGDATMDPLRETTGIATIRVRDTPSIPQGVTLTPGGAGSLVAAWLGSTSNGEPITHYEVILTTPGRAPITASAGLANSFAFTKESGVIPGAPYYAQVRAVNSIGVSDYSAPSGDEIPIDLPQAPQNVTIEDVQGAPGATTGSLTVRWAPPVTDGGGLEGYVITVTREGGAVSSYTVPASATQFEVTGLSIPRFGQTSVSAVVTARNRAGDAAAGQVTGRLLYTPDSKVTLKEGDLVKQDLLPVLRNHKTYLVEGVDFEESKQYTIVCYEGPEKQVVGTQTNVDGKALNAPGGAKLSACVGSLGTYSVDVMLGGTLVATSNTIEYW